MPLWTQSHRRRRRAAKSYSSVAALWMGDSIFAPLNFIASMTAAMPVPTTLTYACYPGTLVGSGLMVMCDSTFQPSGASWVQSTRGIPYSNFTHLMFDYGRNDALKLEGSSVHRRAFDKVIAQGLAKIGAVVAANCPPQALADLSNWNSGDAYPFSGNNYLAAWKTATSKYGVPTYDIYDNWLSYVANGQYTVAQLNRDTLHPTLTTGLTLISQGIAQVFAQRVGNASASPEIAGQVVNYVLGIPAGGTNWALTALPLGSTALPHVSQLPDEAMQSSTIGDVLRFNSAHASQIWLHAYFQNNGGQLTWYIDRGTGQQLTGTVDTNTASNDEHAFLLADNLSASTHAVEVQVLTAAPCAVLGVTYVGA